MSAHFTTPTDELLLLAETLGEVKTKADKLEAEFATQARPLEAATNALSAALSGIKALQFHVLDNNLGQLSARVEEMRKAVDEQVGVIALELKKADETNAAKAGQDAEALRSEISALQAQLGTLGAQFAAQLERVEFSAKEYAKKLQLIPGPAGAAGASLNPRGTFIDGETYNRLDVVSWLGSSYIAAVDGVTEKPSKNSNQWQVLASRGGGAAGGAGDFGSLAGVAQINQGGTGQTTRAAGLNALLPDQAGATQYMLLTDGAGTVSWGAQPVAGLPSQTSNSGKLLTTDGTNASWSNAVTVSGSNATVTGTLSSAGDLSVTGTSAQVILGQSSGSALTYYIRPSQAGGAIQIVQDSGTVNRWLSLGGVNNSAVYTESLRITNGGHVAVTNTTASTTTSSGALVVSGGVGVAGAMNVGSQLKVTNATIPDLWLQNTSGADSAYRNILIRQNSNGTFKFLSTSDAGVLSLDNIITGNNASGVIGIGIAAAASKLHVYESTSGTGDSNGITIEQASTADAALQFLLTGVQRWTVGIDNSDSDKFKIGTGAIGSADRLTIDTSGNLVAGGSVQTAAPSGGTAAAWKLGTVATVSPTSPNRTIEVDIGGTIYYIHAKTTNN